VLPGGILGDVHRGVVHGRRARDLGRGLRAVAWERISGQVVQTVLTGIVLLSPPSPVRPLLPEIAACVVGAILLVALAVRIAARRGRPKLVAAARTVVDDLRRGLLARDAWPPVLLASVLVVVGHTATFVIAARVAGCTASLSTVVALAMLVQTAVVIPLSVGGWGPREGAAAWAFAAAGFGAAPGVTVTTIYAVLGLAAVAPGAGLLLVDAGRRLRRDAAPRSSTGADPVPSVAWEAVGG
jgi:hypothetical protein